MNTGHPRDADPSITGQPHQVTGEDPDLMGKFSCTHGNPVDVPAAVPNSVPPQPCPGPFAAARPRPSGSSDRTQAAPRCKASQTAVLSRAPNSTARPQCAIHAAIPSGVPEA